MSLDRMQSRVGALTLTPLPTSSGFPGGMLFGGLAGFAEGAAASSGGALIQTPRQKVAADIPVVANGNTITHNNCGMVVVSTGGGVTGAIVQAGAFHGQQLTICNNSANTIAMAAAGTSNVASGTAAIVPATAALSLAWNAIDSRWYDVG